MVVARSLIKEALSLRFLLEYIPKETQHGVNDPDTLARQAVQSAVPADVEAQKA
jgi:hypothetical protein